MKDVYDMDSGLSYCAITSEPTLDEPEQEDTFGQGLAIVIGFMCMVILSLAVA